VKRTFRYSRLGARLGQKKKKKPAANSLAMNASPACRTSPRSNKGKPPTRVDWTPDGMCWTVERKQVVLSRNIGGTRVHLTPRAQIRKSGIPSAGNGLFLCHAIPAGSILAEYSGKIIAIHEADRLRTLVRPTPFTRSHGIFLIYISWVQRARPPTSFESAIPSGALIL
jgi:hypothetical protein